MMANTTQSLPEADVKNAFANNPKALIGWLAMVVGMFMAVLDIQIVASSLTDIQAGLAASADEITWVQTSYLIAEIIMIPFSGYLARLLSTRRLFVYSAIGFTIFSFACAFSWSLSSLIVFRIFQGFLGGGMIPCVFASIYQIFPPKKQPIANVVVGLIVTLAPASGPTIGGYITEVLSWHWLFLLNVIPGLLVIFLVNAMPDIDKAQPDLAKGFDWTGLITMALFLGGLEYILDEGPREDWLESRVITSWMIISGISAVIFFWRSFTAKKPLVDLRIFANRTFSAGCLMAFILGIGLFGGIYTVPQFLAHISHYNSLQIGYVMSVAGVFMLLSAPIAGKLTEIVDKRIMLFIGMFLTALGFYLNTFMHADTAFDELFWPQALRGIGLIIMIVCVNDLSLGTLPLKSLSNGSALFNLMRNLGGAIGLAAINTSLNERSVFHAQYMAEWINPARPEYQAYIAHLQLNGITESAVQNAIINHLVNQQSHIMAFNDTHVWMALLFFLGTILLVFVSKPKNNKVAAH